jgi:heme-degrading monooxygenase HmoA
MPAIPWRNLSPVASGREYLVMASRLPLKSHLRIPKFMRLTLVVARQLQHTPGLIGYGLLARPVAKTFWTLSAWDGREALAAFTRTMPHVQVMKDLQAHMMSTTKFTQWTVPGSSLPVSWADAFAHLDRQEQST